ncbi:hypothetical protein MP478_00180 [Chryseobacterium sp. WG14]|uniref:hypothetical protein n=1 Tax=Chryseobacterium sp. WG14 TaxID=2926909 RepID=UPI00211DA86E|nr:hypothetical protein [Chryseobacterium sp. WG14]MCQ9637798.1 hypothetical protein [Chryseobacterium sp. WG14]
MSNQTPVTHRYYPRLSSVITKDDIPDILGFIKDGVTNLLDKIYYKDLQYSKGPKGDSAFYSLSIVSKRIDIEIPGTGIALVLNPDLENNDSKISAFPITVEYQWKILAYLRYFSLGNFSFEPQQIFEVALRVLNVTEEQAIAHFVNTFVSPTDQNITPLMQFVKDINASQNLGLTLPSDATTVTEVVQDIFNKSAGKYASLVGFATYLLTNDLQETGNKVKIFFKSLLPQDIDEFIKEVVLPKFKATLMLSAAIEFPRNILTPVYPRGHANELDPIPENTPGYANKVTLKFGEAVFYADTERGFGYNMDLALSTSTPAQIGNTGFAIDIHNMKIDLSKKENIAEADADGRPKEFMGVYMEYTEIFLPKKWFEKQQTGQTIGISANHLLIGTGGLSGNIAIRPTYSTKTVGNATEVVDYFGDFFSLDYNGLSVKSMDGTSTQQISGKPQLLAYINGLSSPSELKFVYPLKLTTITGEHRTFNKEEEYYQFISTLKIQDLADIKKQTLWFKLGKDPEKAWELGFSNFDIDFHQGQVVRSSLKAALKIKKFKGYDGVTDLIIAVDGEWESKENFKLSAAFLPSGLKMNLFKLLIFNLQRIEIGKKDDNFYIEADTKITFPQGSFGEKLLGEEGIDLPAIRYYANGKFEIAGGSSIIPINIHLNLGPVRMAVTAIHMGTIQRMYKDKMRTYNYIGFDGGININPLGLDVRGNGVKYYYTADNDEMVEKYGGTEESYKDSYFHISTLEVDLVIPGSASASAAVAIIKGALTIPEPGVSTEYRGKVSLQLPKMNISGSAEMAFDPKYPGFLVDASVELPFIIPLGSFGIFGFRGLIGYRYIAHKEAIGMTENDTWYDYYVHPQRGINTDKFIGPQHTQQYSAPFSFGAGASLATLDGRLASLRAMVLLSVPSMFAIDAGLTIISERLGLTEDDPKVPPFYAFVIVGDNSLEIGAGGNFQLNKNNGSFIDIKAEVQMGFFFKNQRPWYVNFGTRDKPIRASLFKDSVNIKAESYLMIAAKGIEAGARVDFNLNLIIVKVFAAIEVGAHISFERPQVGGYIYVEGGAEINLYIISVALFISIYFRVELILPFLILAELKFELKIKLAIFKIKLKVHLSIKWEKDKNVDTSAVPPLTYKSDNPEIDYPKEERLKNAVKGVHMLTNETFDLPVVQIFNAPEPSIKDDDKLPTIPLDTYIDIKIEKGLIPTPVAGEKIGGHTSGATEFTDLIPPQKTQPGGHVLRQVKHQYSIEDVEIKILNTQGNGWNKYNPYRAVLTDAEANSIANIDKFKLGFWQKTNDKYDTIRILASTPFSFLDSAQPGWFIPEQYGITASSLFCTQTEDVWHESNVLDKTVGTVYYQPAGSPYNFINGAYYNLLGTVSDATDYMMVSNASNPHNHPKSLKITNGNTMVVLLPEASAKVKLLLSTMASTVTIRYYKDVFSNAIYQNYAIIDEVTKTKAELGAELMYDAANFGGQYVSKIEIIPYNANQQEIDDINAQIDLIWANATANTTGEVSTVVLSPTQQAEYDELIEILKELKAGGCTTGQCNELDFDVMHVEDGYNGAFGNGLVNFSMSNISNGWADYDTQYRTITSGNTPPFVDFNTHSVIFLYLPDSPVAQFIKHNSVVSKITDKADGIDVCYSSEYPKEKINKAVIIKVNKTTQKPLNLKFTPDCGCDEKPEPCTKDVKLCDFLTGLMYNLNQCIVYYGVDDVTQLRYNLKCFQIYMEAIYSFDKEFPQYNLVQGIGYVRELLKKLADYLNTEGSTIFGALQLTKEINDVIFKLGNCGCNDDSDGNGNAVTQCYTLFHRVNWMTVTDYEYQQTIPSQDAVTGDMQLMQEAMSKVIQPVWRPNSVYYINLKLKDNVNGDTPHIIDYYFAFKTAGPIGHFEKKNEKYIEYLKDDNGNLTDKKKNIDEYPITSLKSYIDMKKSYPNADGDLLMSKPLFYGNEQCKIEFFFTKPYIYHMLKTWEAHNVMDVKKITGSINIAIKDPVTNVSIPYPLPQDWVSQETIPVTQESWAEDDPNLPLGIQQMLNYVNHVNQGNTGMACSIDLGDPVVPKSYKYSVELTNLNPEKLYTAIVYNAFDDDGDGHYKPQITPVPGKPDKVYEENQKIHEFVFRTSRYKDFKEQVESYKLKEYDDKGLVVIGQKDAIYEVKADLKQQQLNDLYILASEGVENPYLKGLANTYSEVFDRAFEGVMGLKPLNPPTHTEFVKIINTNNEVAALLIRNPEPFNDPKIPLGDMADCFKVLNAVGEHNKDFQIIYAKDYSQILVMHKSNKIKDSKLKLEFTYKSWDGSAYAKRSTVTINELQLNN